MITAVIVDAHAPSWVQRLSFGGAPVIVSELQCGGDVVCTVGDGRVIVFMRMTPTDFAASMPEGYLFHRAVRMVELSPWSYLVLTGPLLPGPDGLVTADGRPTGFSHGAIQGALLTLQEVGVAVAWAAGETDFEAAVLRICHRGRYPHGAARPQAHVLGLDPQALILTALPDIDPEKAAALLSYAGSAAWALTYLTDLTVGQYVVPGIGPATKQKARQALGLGQDAALTIFYPDLGAEGQG